MEARTFADLVTYIESSIEKHSKGQNKCCNKHTTAIIRMTP